MCSSCCYSCLKGVVMMVNMVVMLLGLSMAGVAVWLLVSEYLYLNSSWSDFSLLSCVVLALGLLGSVVAFLACCGAITNSRCLLGMFIIFLLALLVGEVTLAVLIYFKEVDPEPLLREGLHEIVMEKYQQNNTATTIFWDTIQHQGECCGSSGPSDWAFSLYNGYQDSMKEIGIGAQQAVLPFTIPSSCCRDLDDPLCSSTITPKFKTNIDESIYFSEGCFTVAVNFINSNRLYLGIASLIIICIEVLGVIFTTCLCCTIKKIEDMKP